MNESESREKQMQEELTQRRRNLDEIREHA